MAIDSMTRWTITVSKETDIALRTHLAQRGMKKGDISKFVEDAVKWRVFDQTLAEVREGFNNLAPDELQAIINEAVDDARIKTYGRIVK